MNILLIHQHFKLPSDGGGIRSYYLAKALTAAGHKVNVLTAHDSHRVISQIGDFSVHYFHVPYHNKFGFIRRVIAFFSFVSVCNKYLLREQRPDLSYVISTPLTTGYIGLFGKKKFGIPYIFEVGDLWPEAPIQLGVIRNGWLKRKLYALEREIYQQALHIIALSPPIKAYINNVVSDHTPVSVVPNMSDCAFFQSEISVSKKTYTKTSPLQIAYTGALAFANHLDYLLELATALREAELPVKIHIMGDGAEREKIEKQIASHPNVKLHAHGDKDAVKKLLESCDAIYVSYKKAAVLTTGSPNKLFDGLAAGKLIILNFDGWIKDLLEKHNCGFSHDPENPNAAVEILSALWDNPEQIALMQQNAADLARDAFDVPKLTHEVVEIVASLEKQMETN